MKRFGSSLDLGRGKGYRLRLMTRSMPAGLFDSKRAFRSAHAISGCGTFTIITTKIHTILCEGAG